MLSFRISKSSCRKLLFLFRSQRFKHLRYYSDDCDNIQVEKVCGDSGNDRIKDFFTSLASQKCTEPTNKITVIGCGQVGMACIVSCLVFGITSELCIFDKNIKLAQGEALDLKHASLFLRGANIYAANNLEDTANSKIIIVTAGEKQKPGEKRPELISKNIEIFKTFIPEVAKHSPCAILIIVSNPCDPMTYVAWKMSGFPINRVFGSGTNLDSARLRFHIAEKLNVSVTDTQAHVIGEHGDTSVPVWSGASVAGVLVRPQLPHGTHNDPENWDELHRKTVNAAYDVIALKCYTSWAIGFSVGQLSKVIMNNLKHIHPISTSIKGHYGIQDDVFVSIPCIIGAEGVNTVINITLTDYELELFKASIDACREMQKSYHQ